MRQISEARWWDAIYVCTKSAAEWWWWWWCRTTPLKQSDTTYIHKKKYTVENHWGIESKRIITLNEHWLFLWVALICLLHHCAHHHQNRQLLFARLYILPLYIYFGYILHAYADMYDINTHQKHKLVLIFFFFMNKRLGISFTYEHDNMMDRESYVFLFTQNERLICVWIEIL